MDIKKFENFKDWEREADVIGWVHRHDDVLVCDDPDTDFLLGEWVPEENSGWLVDVDTLI